MTAWREFRAYVATILYGWAQAASMEATLELSRMVVRLAAEDADMRARRCRCALVEVDAYRGDRVIGTQVEGDAGPLGYGVLPIPCARPGCRVAPQFTPHGHFRKTAAGGYEAIQ